MSGKARRVRARSGTLIIQQLVDYFAFVVFLHPRDPKPHGMGGRMWSGFSGDSDGYDLGIYAIDEDGSYGQRKVL